MMRRILILAALLISAQAGGLSAQAQAPPASCNWEKVLQPNEVRFPVQMDTHAAYALYAFKTDGSIALNIEGQFPYAAFLSFTTYDAKGLLFSALLDKNIAADAGSVNPFQPGQLVNAPNRSYRIQVVPSGQKANLPNAVYMPPIPSGSTDATMVLVLRVYLPEPDRDRTGGVPLPVIKAVKASDLSTPVQCPTLAGPTDFGSFGGFSPAPAPRLGRIRFYRPPVSMVPFADGSQQLKPGDCTTYLMATLEADKIAVIRFKKIPTFFDNSSTKSSTIFNVTQVRYLSLGSYGASLIPPPGRSISGNIAGPDIQKTTDGGVTFVVVPDSLPLDIQSQIGLMALRKGFNVLPMAKLGPKVPPFLIYRNKVADSGYAGDISGVPCFNDPKKPFDQATENFAASTSNMGAYAPLGVECSVSEFLGGRCGQQ